MAKQKVDALPSAAHPPVLVYFHKEAYYEDHANAREWRAPTGEARLNQSQDTLQCRNDASHLIKNGEYYTVEGDEPVCFKCRPFKLGQPNHKPGNPNDRNVQLD